MNGIRIIGNGGEAYETLKKHIRKAETSILINVFIWRDDAYCRRLAEELVSAADRGVRITVSADQDGVVLEKAEESMKSLFHEQMSLKERLSVAVLKKGYPNNTKTEDDAVNGSALYKKLLDHPNVTLDIARRKSDHSKYYLFDERILLMGGVNIEQKEFDRDSAGRFYKDYLIEISDKDMITAFLNRLRSGAAPSGTDACPYRINRKQPERIFELESHYLQLIEAAGEELLIAMAYFGPVKELVKAITDASDRGVRVTVILPAYANYMDDMNKLTASELVRRSGGRITVRWAGCMLHAKVIVSDNSVSVGSCNITHRSLTKLDELNYYSADPAFAEEMKKDLSGFIDSVCLTDDTAVKKYNKIKAVMECLFS